MSPALRRLVTERAEGCCEYCLIHFECTVIRHHVEHIQAKQHGGTDEPDNLALACHHCNEYKGPNLTGIDPEDNKLSRHSFILDWINGKIILNVSRAL